MAAEGFIFHQVFLFFYNNENISVVKIVCIDFYISYIYVYVILDGKTWESSKLLPSYPLSDVHGSVSADKVSPT